VSYNEEPITYLGVSWRHYVKAIRIYKQAMVQQCTVNNFTANDSGRFIWADTYSESDNKEPTYLWMSWRHYLNDLQIVT
jgi:hypothetical protein